MKKTLRILLIAFIIPAFVFTSCKDEPIDEIVEFEVLTQYLVDQGLDISNVLSYEDVKFVAGAPAEADLQTFLAKYYIIDIRSADAYNTGHIEGAVNVTWENVLSEAQNAGDKQILMVCYSGQNACYATALLRLYGYPKTQALKWGMSGWNSTTAGAWNGNIDNLAASHANWSYDAAPQNSLYSNPVLNTSKTTGEDILKARVEDVFAAGLKSVSASDALESPELYQINNYFSETDYLGFGHINGAYRINPLLLNDDSYMNLNPEAKIVTYCYTGQTSAIITAYLNVIGYEAYSLMFGMNKLYNSNTSWTSNQWGGDSNPKDLPLISAK